MRHLKAGRALGVKPAHRRAMLRNMVTSVLEHQQIKTTVARAKELRKPLDRLITLGKRGDLAARRRALSVVRTKAAMTNLFGELAERYSERPGGFSRIIRIANRRGDGAEMALFQLVGAPNDPFGEEKKPAGKRKRGDRKQSKKVLEEVAEKVEAETASDADAEPESEAAPQQAAKPATPKKPKGQ